MGQLFLVIKLLYKCFILYVDNLSSFILYVDNLSSYCCQPFNIQIIVVLDGNCPCLYKHEPQSYKLKIILLHLDWIMQEKTIGCFLLFLAL